LFHIVYTTASVTENAPFTHRERITLGTRIRGE
jgi:hypothetical protein